MKVYVLSFVDYDAFYLEGVFSTMEKALDFVVAQWPRYTVSWPPNLELSEWTLDDGSESNYLEWPNRRDYRTEEVAKVTT